MKHFLSLVDLTPEQVAGLIRLAVKLKAEWSAGGNQPVLRHKTLGMIFTRPSLRTRVSFEMAMLQLGGQALYLSPNEISLGQRESVADVARVLSRYVDIIMARVFGHRDVLELAQYARVPVINGLSQATNGVEILITNLALAGSTFNADVCYNLPAAGYDSQLAASPDDVNLTLGAQIAVLDSIQATGAEKNNTYTAANYRCVRLAFTLAPNSDVSNVTLTIKKVFGFTVDNNCDRSNIRFEGHRAPIRRLRAC